MINEETLNLKNKRLTSLDFIELCKKVSFDKITKIDLKNNDL